MLFCKAERRKMGNKTSRCWDATMCDGPFAWAPGSGAATPPAVSGCFPEGVLETRLRSTTSASSGKRLSEPISETWFSGGQVFRAQPRFPEEGNPSPGARSAPRPTPQPAPASQPGLRKQVPCWVLLFVFIFGFFLQYKLVFYIL